MVSRIQKACVMTRLGGARSAVLGSPHRGSGGAGVRDRDRWTRWFVLSDFAILRGLPAGRRHRLRWDNRTAAGGRPVCRPQIDLSAHCAPAVSAHAFCAVQRLRHLEYFYDHVRIESMLFDGTLSPVGEQLAPAPACPGLGLDLRASDNAHYLVHHSKHTRA